MSTGYQLNTGKTYRAWSNRETVSLFNAAGQSQGVVVDAKRLRQNTAEAARSQGKYLRNSIDFRLPAANVASGPIIPGWYVVDSSSVAWVIQELDEPSTYGATWNCYCIQLQIVADVVTVTRPVDSTDAYSSPITTAGMPITYQGHIQFDYNFVDDFQGAQYVRAFYKVWLMGLNGTAADLPLGSIVTATAGEYNGMAFRVVESANIDLIDELPRYTATVDPA